MTEVFLDTSYAVALASRRDQHYEKALELADYIEQQKLRKVTTWAVVLEIGNALSTPRFRQTAVNMLEYLDHDPTIEIIPLSELLYQRGFELFRQRPDKQWGLVFRSSSWKIAASPRRSLRTTTSGKPVSPPFYPTAEPPVKDPTLLDYYARRAEEYEQIYQKPERLVELSLLKAYLIKLLAGRDVLEVACGTGYWTAHLAPFTRSILATDASREMLDVARSKAYPEGLRFERADAYVLDAIAGHFIAGFAGFWWSHVPKAHLPGFLSTFHSRLQPGARVVFVDNQYVEGSSTPLSATDPAGNTYQQRRLADDSRHRILKNFPTEADPRNAVGDAGTKVRYVDLTYYWCLSYTLREEAR